MNGQVQITVTSSDSALNGILSQTNVVGATFNYGINRIPVAQLQLDPSSLSLFCNFDQARRKPVTIIINSVLGCLRFDGLIDGNSISQQPGGLSTSLIVKHPFTYLNEVYPRILGLNASTMNAFAINQTLTVDASQIGTANTLAGFIAGIRPLPNLGLTQIDTKQNIIDYIVTIMKAIVISQTNGTTVLSTSDSATVGSVLTKVIQAGQLNSLNLAPTITNLLSQINTQFTQGFNLPASTPSFCSLLLTDICTLEDTVFHNLLKLINQYGCALVIGNTTAFIIPETPYLKITKNATLYNKQKSNQYNMALPADYTGFSFNDQGENTVKGVYVVQEPIANLCKYPVDNANGIISGYFFDPNPNVFGNIVVRTLPSPASSYLAYSASLGSAGIQQNIVNRTPVVNAAVDTQSAYESMIIQDTLDNASVAVPLQNYLNQWAEIEYCKIKYGDRTGSITMPYNNNWTPGAPGSVYTRYPGTYVDFYVTDVTHNFSIQAPNGGDATTQVLFNGGRPGAATEVGLDIVSLYQYDYADSLNFCADFIGDIGDTAAGP